MPVLMQIEFPVDSPYSKVDPEEKMPAAQNIAVQPGLISKIWIYDDARLVAGGVYLFEDRARAESYAEKHRAYMAERGIDDFTIRIFDIIEPLTAATFGHLGRAP